MELLNRFYPLVFSAIIFLLFLGIVSAQQSCNTGADNSTVNPIADCDGDVSETELIEYIQLWYGCSSCYPDMFQAIEAWFESSHQPCVPDCAGRECGDDGCGGSCLPGCDSGYYCNSSHHCEEMVVQMADHITQYGITWYFDREYHYGTFANGDYWVVNPYGGDVVITRITPQS